MSVACSVCVCVCVRVTVRKQLLAGGSAVTCCLPAESVSLLCEVFVPLQSSGHLDRVVLTPGCMVASPLPLTKSVFFTYSL